MENKIIPERGDLALAGGMVLCGFLFWEGGMISPDAALGKFTFTLIICLVSGVYLMRAGYRQDRRSIAALVCMAALAGSFVLISGRTEHAVTLPILGAIYLYWVAGSCNATMEDNISMYAIGDIVKQSCVIPFINYEACPVTVAHSSRGKGGKNILMVAIGLLLALPLMIAVFLLLGEADSSFSKLAAELANRISWKWLEYLGELILGIPVAFYLFGHVYGNAKGRRADGFNKESLSKAKGAVAVFPPLIGSTILVCLNIIYIVFLGLQVVHLMRGLPSGMSYSEFARQGFFQLCEVAVLNLLIVIAAEVLHKRGGNQATFIRAQISLMSTLTIGLSVTALAKMFMYIKVYGLTHLRIYTSFFMVFLIIVFMTIALSQFVRINSGKVICITALALLLVFNYAGIDRTIAKYNIARYENGTLDMMDDHLLYSLSDGAIPELYELWEKTKDPVLGEVLSGIPANDSWGCWSIERARADRARADYRKAISADTVIIN